ncbi:MAG TPA: hypothetical protein VF474_09965 [Phenylobacterium sp.]
MSVIAFMHIGEQTQLPTIMVRSFRRHNPGIRIVQVADQDSPAIEGVDDTVRSPMADGNVMLFRMRCFAALATEEPTWFLDTDMLCNRPLELDEADVTVAVCQREFGTQAIFNHRFGGMDLSEYEGRTMGSIYPYVGCATYVNRSNFWADCLQDMEALDPKFFNWYGDQEAIRNVVNSSQRPVAMLRESLYACLPEHAGQMSAPYIFHYKGQRKRVMLERAAAEGLL